MAKHWIQIGGDVNPRDQGATLARHDHSSLGAQIELVEITPSEDLPGGETPGKTSFFVQRASIPVDELTWEKNRDVARSSGHDRRGWESSALEHRAMDRLNHWGAAHLGGDHFYTMKWSDALPARSNQIRWWR